MIAEVASSGTRTPKATTPGVDTASIVEDAGSGSGQAGETDGSVTHAGEGSGEQTLVASVTSASIGKGKGKDEASDEAKEEEETKGSNLVGKINNLMSTDLENMVEGRDFLLILVYAPVQIVGSIIFLYQILGWR